MKVKWVFGLSFVVLGRSRSLPRTELVLVRGLATSPLFYIQKRVEKVENPTAIKEDFEIRKVGVNFALYNAKFLNNNLKYIWNKKSPFYTESDKSPWRLILRFSKLATFVKRSWLAICFFDSAMRSYVVSNLFF